MCFKVQETWEYVAKIFFILFFYFTIWNSFRGCLLKNPERMSAIRTRIIELSWFPSLIVLATVPKDRFCWLIFLSAPSAHWTTTKPPGLQRHHYNSNREMGPCARPRPELQNHPPARCRWKSAVCKFGCPHSPSIEMFWSRAWAIFHLWWWVAESVLWSSRPLC